MFTNDTNSKTSFKVICSDISNSLSLAKNGRVFWRNAHGVYQSVYSKTWWYDLGNQTPAVAAILQALAAIVALVGLIASTAAAASLAAVCAAARRS